MIISPQYVEFARRWVTLAGLDASEASDDELMAVVRRAYDGGWRQLKRDADAVRAMERDAAGVRQCYVARGEDGRPEAVHEGRPCACGKVKARV